MATRVKPSRRAAATAKSHSGESAPGWMSVFIAGAAALLIVTLIAYFPALRAGYIWDDPQYVVDNVNLRDFEGLYSIWFQPRTSPQYYPLVFTSFWIEYQLWGLSPFGYHLDNVLLHAASSVL